MFGICLIHVAGFSCGFENKYISLMNLFAVPGFVFISGYYGIKFRFKKLLSLYFNAFYACVVVQIVKLALGVGDFEIVEMLKMFRGFWFLNAYAVLMMFSPVLNHMLSGVESYSLERKKTFLKSLSPVFLLIFGWGWVRSIPWCNGYIFVSPGVEPMSGLMMIGVYLFARLIRLWNVKNMVTKRFLILVLVLGYPIEFLGLGSYTSIVASFMAFAWFVLIKDSVYCERLGKYVAWMVPSLFSIYLLHAHNAVGFPLITRYNYWLVEHGLPLGVMYFVSSASVFIVGIILDLPRRFLLRTAKFLP